MKEGDLIFVRSRSIGGWLIRWTTQGYFNHIAYALGEYQILETSGTKGVTEAYIGKYDDKHKYKVVIGNVPTASPSDIYAITKWLRNQAGERYDYLQIIAMFFHRITGTLGSRTYIDKKSLDVCSSLIAKGFALRDIFFRKDVHINNLSPQDIYNSKLVTVRKGV